jgi:predicted nucleic acid-binding protein
MRTTINLDDELIKKAADLTGRREKSALVRLGREALIARESARRLARPEGADPEATAAPRRLVEPSGLHGTGLSVADAHLLAAARINDGVRLWTRDKRLRTEAEHLDVAATGLT